MMDIYEDSVLLIGPPHVGKNKVGTSLSEKMNMPLINISLLRDKYYKDMNYDREYASKLKREGGELARYEYSKPFEAYFVDKFLRGLTESGIYRFEASQTVYEDSNQFDSIFKSIKEFKNVILLLPDMDLLDSWHTINKLSKAPTDSDLSKLNWHLVSSSCNTSLATDIIYTNGRTADDIADEIVSIVNKKKNNEGIKTV